MSRSVGTSPLAQKLRQRFAHEINHFARAEDGVMLALVMMMMLIMFTVAGVGVDLMRTEMERTRLQQTVDSAALAAAHKDNTLQPKQVVMDYFAKANLASYISEDDITIGGVGLSTSVTVDLSAEVQTPFLKNLGFPTFTVPAIGRAEQAYGNSEVSLVLDISGSMDENNRMTRLHTAANEFVDTVINSDSRDRVSLSLVPYTGDVNIGWDLMSRLNVRQVHSYSYCVQLTPADFSTTAVNPGDHYLQGQHFSHVDSGFNYISCPTQSYETVTPHSQNASALKSQINQLTGRERTSIHIGVKWGVALLDQAFRPVITSLVDASKIDEAFRGRPADNGSQTLKVLVVMTDGINTQTNRIKDFAYDTPDMRAHWAKWAMSDWEYDVDSSVRDDLYDVYYTGTMADSLLQNICTAAKNEGIIIYSIGFEIDDTSAAQMELCASSPSHFYRVEGVSISDAFASIARQLQQLRLTL
ncbi:pilus assembly protein TadG-related protein [Pseudooceanicola sp. MF1-13]|uniref:TadE/TadG family type IV pilus assembly protein n=1 Tax=Pseudooceanicola sp. MF1-13 TaxID=3379095 RepID=UPI003892715D